MKNIFAVTIIIASMALFAIFPVAAQVTNIKVDWENGAQYYYYISGSSIKKIIAFQDTLPGIYEYWDAIDHWVPMQTDRAQTYKMLFDGGQPVTIKNSNSSVYGGGGSPADSALSNIVAPYTGTFMTDTSFAAMFSWDDTLGGALVVGSIGTPGDSTIFKRSGNPVHPDTVGGKEIYAVFVFTVHDTLNGAIMLGLVPKDSLMMTDTRDTTNGIYIRKNTLSSKLQVWKARNHSVDSLTIVDHCVKNTKYTVGFYDNGRGTTDIYLNGTRMGALESFTPWDKDLTFGLMFSCGASKKAFKTGMLYYAEIVQNQN